MKGASSRMYDPGLETMSSADRKTYHESRLGRAIAHAYQNAAAVRERLDKAGIAPGEISTLSDLQRLPVTTKEELLGLQKRNPPFGGLLAVPPGRAWKFFASTGPIYDVVGRSEEFWHMQKKVFHNVGFRSGDVVLIAFSYHLVPAAWDADEALRQLGAVVIPGGTAAAEDQMEAAQKMGATGYIGTPSFLLSLIRKAEERGYDFRRDFKLRRAAVGAEPLTVSLRHELETTYGVSVFNMFGTADIQWVGYECEHKNGMHIVEEVLMEIVDPETGKTLPAGEVGEIVITSFDEAYPLIRFGLGDLACLSDEPCPCGRTSPRLVRFAGRVRDVVRVRGRFIYPADVKKTAEAFSEISRYQLSVSRREHKDELTFSFEPSAGRVAGDDLMRSIQALFKENCLLKLDKVVSVPCGTITGEKIIVDVRKWE